MKVISHELSDSSRTDGDAASSATAWARLFIELRKDAPFFAVLGFALGIVQKIGHDYFAGSNVGTQLLEEQIAFKSLVCLLVIVWVIKLLHRLRGDRSIRWVADMVAHVEARIIAWGSVATLTIVGFTLSALMFGEISDSIVFLTAALYFAAITLLAATPAQPEDIKRPATVFAWALTWAVPFTFTLAPLVRWTYAYACEHWF